MKMKPIIIGIGELLWDMLPSGKKAGGAPINFVYHTYKLGADSYAVSAVGNDLLGDEILEEINKTGINHIINRVDYPTGTVNVSLEDGIPTYTIIENVAWDYIQTSDKLEELVKSADVVCFGTLAQRSETSRNIIQTILSLVPVDAYRIFDINLRERFYTKKVIDESLNKCNVFKINHEELQVVKQKYNIEHLNERDSCQWFIDKFKLKYLIPTAGSDYSIIMTPEIYSNIKTPIVEVIDTVGAGDSFTAAFIVSILNGKSLEESHKAAVERSALVCTKEGAWVTEN